MIIDTEVHSISYAKLIKKPLKWYTLANDYFHLSENYNMREQNIVLQNSERIENFGYRSNRFRGQTNTSYSQTIGVETFRFRKTFLFKDIVNGHFQLHYCLKSISSGQLLVPRQNGTYLLNNITGKLSRVFEGSGIKSIDFDKDSGMIVSTPVNKVFVCNLYTDSKKSHVKFFSDDEVISRCLFTDSASGQRQMVAVGNDPAVKAMDLTSEKIRVLFHGRDNTNSIGFSPYLKIYALAQDKDEIELKDERSPKNVGLLEGHEDSNFSCEFMTSWRLATAGQDLSVRIWDLRYPAGAVYTFQNNSCCYALTYSPRRDRLFAIENANRVRSYNLNGELAQVSTFQFVGKTVGLSLSPDEDSLFVGVHQMGVLDIDILDN